MLKSFASYLIRLKDNNIAVDLVVIKINLKLLHSADKTLIKIH